MIINKYHIMVKLLVIKLKIKKFSLYNLKIKISINCKVWINRIWKKIHKLKVRKLLKINLKNISIKMKIKNKVEKMKVSGLNKKFKKTAVRSKRS